MFLHGISFETHIDDRDSRVVDKNPRIDDRDSHVVDKNPLIELNPSKKSVIYCIVK